ncbi:MAG: hypothetical protein AB1Z23_06830 [Eubacteriales bacterium]
MDIFKFKNNKKYVRLAFLYILILILSRVTHRAFEHNFSAAIIDISMGVIIYYIFYKTTNENIYIGDHQLIAKATVPYMMITEIRASSEIQIICEDGRNGTIKMLDIERNYDSYKELLDTILSKISKEAKDRSGTAEELLDRVIEAKKFIPIENEKTKLGGWLSFIKTVSIIGLVVGLICLMGFIPVFVFLNGIDIEKGELMRNSINFVSIFINSIFFIFVLVMLDKRTKKVKYPVIGIRIVSVLTSLALGLIGVLYTEGYNLVLSAVNILINIILAFVLIMIVLDYFENSDRAKYTLVN